MKFLKILIFVFFSTSNLFADAIDPETGKYLIGTADGGAIDPETGKYYPAAGDGHGSVIDPETGKFYPGTGDGGVVYIDPSSSKKQITNTPPSREQIINRAWRKSEGYRRFKMGTISKLESESAEDYNKWVEQKEERAKRSWIKRCKSGLEKDCWVEPVFEQKDKKIIVYERKQDKPKEKDVSWRKTLDNRVIKPADPSPIRKEKKNGVWKFSN